MHNLDKHNLDIDFDFLNLTPLKKEHQPEKIHKEFRSLNIRGMVDDFYSTCIDWHKENIFYVVEGTVYAYNFYSEITKSIFTTNISITSVKYCSKQQSIVCGTSLGTVFFIDENTLKVTKKLIHKSRIGVIKNFQNREYFEYAIITGSRDRKTKIIDTRIKEPAMIFSSHTQEVCGIAQSNLLATGGNDNRAFIYDLRTTIPFGKVNEHKAAIKAIDWTIKGNNLITGGGSADKTIKVFSINKKVEMIKNIQFTNQVTNLKCLSDNSIICTFGYSDNDIKILKNYKVEKVYEGHKNRVIHFGINEDQKYIATGSGDFKIKFWKIGEENDLKKIK
ncbi:FZR2 [Hepatospora eriocheir]|uniref:FZR2 n=1 Tax=Hepatospora eriocheir TaxID=1081669 RepID=A0A1X0Q929_9MICR|nr:FZR2 [Hepatospora eriocheir]ORE00300.1 FZR2 [Hepatospora eriocheir]